MISSVLESSDGMGPNIDDPDDGSDILATMSLMNFMIFMQDEVQGNGKRAFATLTKAFKDPEADAASHSNMMSPPNLSTF